MNHYCFSMFLLAFLASGETLAFSSRPAFASPVALEQRSGSARRSASSMRYSDEQALHDEVNLDEQSLWRRHLQSEEIKQVRQELVQKYLAWGKPKAVAEVEVDDFLGDKSKSEEFLEMRHHAHEESEEGEILGLMGAFLFGFLGSLLPKYYDLYQTSFPNGDGPIPFL